MWVISNRMIPPIVIVFPIFLLVRLGWVDSRIGLIVLYTAFNLPYVIWMSRGYIKEVPIELGDPRWLTAPRSSRPSASSSCRWSKAGFSPPPSFTFVFAWNDFIFALVLLTRNAADLPGPGHPLFRRPVQLLGCRSPP
ncbi:MAG: hypothetical protein R3D25_03405 [Geminicoccaceae bacterium]